MTDKNLNTIVEFLEELKEQFEDAPEARVRVSYTYLCEVLAATGKYDDMGYKYAEVTQADRNEKYSLDQHNSKEEFLHEFKD